MKNICIVLITLFLFVIAGCSSVEKKHSTPWKTDIAFLKKEISVKQKNIYSKITKKDFEAEIDSIYKESPGLDDKNIRMKITKLVAKIKDANTYVEPEKSANLFALEFYIFEDGTYLFGSSEDNKKFIGKKLVRINNVEIKEIYDKIKPYISYENQPGLKRLLPSCIINGDLLKYIGILENASSASYEFETGEGNKIKKEILNIEVLKKPETMVNYWGISKIERPITENTKEKNYYYTYIKSVSAVYFQYNKGIETKNKKFKEFVKEMFKKADKEKVKNMIIDLRYCNSGDVKIFERDFMPMFKKSRYNQDGYGFVITGRETYGAGVAAAAVLVETGNIAVFGENTITGPNHIAEKGKIKLPFSKIEINYSKSYLKVADEDVEEIRPDYNIKYYSSDYLNGKDVAFEAVIRYLKTK